MRCNLLGSLTSPTLILEVPLIYKLGQFTNCQLTLRWILISGACFKFLGHLNLQWSFMFIFLFSISNFHVFPFLFSDCDYAYNLVSILNLLAPFCFSRVFWQWWKKTHYILLENKCCFVCVMIRSQALHFFSRVHFWG